MQVSKPIVATRTIIVDGEKVTITTEDYKRLIEAEMPKPDRRSFLEFMGEERQIQRDEISGY